AALLDPHAGVRRQAVRLSEPWLGKDDSLSADVLKLVDDPEVTVRYQLALSLGEWDDPRSGQALGRLARRDGHHAWVRGAILSSAVRQPAAVLSAIDAPDTPSRILDLFVEPLVATLLGSDDPKAFASALAIVNRAGDGPMPPWRLRAAAELLDSPR